MNKVLKAFGPSHVTTYLLQLENKKIMLDFNCDECAIDDLKTLDYIFISHEHLDHFGSLLNYPTVKKLNSNVRIFASRTTKKLISHIAREKNYTEEASKLIYGLIDNIEECLFNEEIELDNNLKITLFRSGHTFGSSMIYINDNGTTYLYTGDMDYVSSNPSRQYNLPYHIDVDYWIIDGTNFFKDDFKGVNYKPVKEYLSHKKDRVFSYYVRPEKAIFYGMYLADKLDGYIFMYTNYMNWYLKIITEEGYNPYIVDKVVYKLPMFVKENELLKNKKIIEFVDKDESKKGNDVLTYRLSLHISKYDLVDMINSHASKTPKAVLVGHYNNPNKEALEQLDLSNVILVKKGDNIIG